jgi:hypothetical protein
MRGFRGIRFVEFLIVAFVGKAGFFDFLVMAERQNDRR